MITQAIAVLCVIGLALGQILFKLSANSLAETGSFFAAKTASILLIAMTLYGVTTLAWVWLLQKSELGQVYPFMALAFILVPMGSYFIFGEKFQLQYFLGVALIIIGILITIRSNV